MTEEKDIVVEKEDAKKNTSTGLDENVGGVLCYLLGIVTGILFFILEKENRFIRFHAMQSILICAVLIVVNIFLSFIPVIGWMINLLIAPVAFVLWLLLMYKAYNKEWFKLPVLGDMAEKQINK